MAPALTFLGAVLFGTAAGASAAYVLAVNLARFAILSLASKLAAPKIDLTESAANKMLTIRSTVQPQKFTYGTDMLSGPLVFANTTGDGNKELTRIVARHGREINDIIGFRIDDTTISIGVDIANRGPADVTGGQFEDVMFVDSRLGTLTQTAIPDMTSRYPTLWLAGSHRLRGWSAIYTRMTLESGNNAYQNGIPQNMRALCEGHRVYDPRLDDTNGGTGPHRLNDDTTWEFSENPALCLADFLRWENVGYSEDDARIDWPKVIIAADICDEQVTVPTPPALQKRYTCNFTFLANTPREQIKEMLETAMMGRAVFSQGQWKMWAGAPITADVTLSEANMANKNLQVQATSGSAERFNRVRGKFVDPSRNFTANAYPEQRNAAFESADNGPKYEVFDINTCNDSFEAQRDAQIKLCQSRNQRIVVFPGNWSCFRIQPGSVVELDIAELGFSGEKFFVTQWELATDGSGVQLTMVEENDACWTQTFQYVVRSPTGELQFNLFGNCKLSGDNIHRFAVGTSASAGYKMRSDGILEYQLADGTYTTVGVPIDEWMLTPLPFWTKTEQNFGDPLDVGTLSVIEPLTADVEFSITQGGPGSKEANLTTEIYLDEAGTQVECSATYDLEASVQAPIFVRDTGAIWDKGAGTGNAALPQPSQKVVGDDMFAIVGGAGLVEPEGLGVRWFKHFHLPFSGGNLRFYQRIGGVTNDADDDFDMLGITSTRTQAGALVVVANDHSFFTPPIQNLIQFQGGVLNQATRGEFDTSWDMLAVGGLSLAEKTDPPDLATEAHNTWVFSIYFQYRTLGNPFHPNPLVSFDTSGGPQGTDPIIEHASSSGFESSVMIGLGGKFYANSTQIDGESLAYSVTTGFTIQALQYSRWRPS
jgi:hypothetical protein